MLGRGGAGCLNGLAEQQSRGTVGLPVQIQGVGTVCLSRGAELAGSMGASDDVIGDALYVLMEARDHGELASDVGSEMHRFSFQL